MVYVTPSAWRDMRRRSLSSPTRRTHDLNVAVPLSGATHTRTGSVRGTPQLERLRTEQSRTGRRYVTQYSLEVRVVSTLYTT